VDEVLVVAALAEEVAVRAAADQEAVLDAPERRLLTGFLELAQVGDDLAVLFLFGDLADLGLVRLGEHLPAGQVLAVDELDEALVVRGRRAGRQRNGSERRG